MRKKNLSFLIFFLFYLFLSCNSSTKKETVPKNSSNLTGQESYVKNCSACHGNDGNMGLAGAKRLPESALTQQEREKIISNGKNNMPAFKDKLNPEEIKKVAEYTFTLK